MNEVILSGFVVRDKNGALYLYCDETHFKIGSYWCTKDGSFLEIDDELFPEITWNDEEPTPVEITLKVTERNENM